MYCKTHKEKPPVSIRFYLINKDKKIVVIVIGLVDMWITPLKDVKTVYLHVDRLCVKQGKLFTLFSYYFKIPLISS
ncbi:hypothetical protein ABE42_01375, partial [Bacillus thuringiensis]|nr:hypothetical protein [Bacillus thuringiensis]